MVKGMHKSNSLRQVFRKTPGGETVTHYRPRKPSNAKCAKCGAVLKGTPRARPVEMQNMPKTQKRPERPYGGVLCSSCMRSKIKDQARV